MAALTKGLRGVNSEFQEYNGGGMDSTDDALEEMRPFQDIPETGKSSSTLPQLSVSRCWEQLCSVSALWS